jgi:hypothetical protein
MTYSLVKLIVVAVLALALVAALVFDSDSSVWAVPLLGLLIGYTIGNASVSGNEPIVSDGER